MRPATARTGSLGRPKVRTTASLGVTRSIVDASCSSCVFAIVYGPVIALAGGVHGRSRRTTSVPVRSTGATSTIAATRGHARRHQCAASAPISNPMTRYQYTSNFVLSQFQDWNTTRLQAAKTTSAPSVSSSRGTGNALVSERPTFQPPSRAAVAIATKARSGTAIPRLATQNPHQRPVPSTPTAWTAPVNTLPIESVSLPLGSAMVPALASHPGSSHGYTLVP